MRNLSDATVFNAQLGILIFSSIEAMITVMDKILLFIASYKYRSAFTSRFLPVWQWNELKISDSQLDPLSPALTSWSHHRLEQEWLLCLAAVIDSLEEVRQHLKQSPSLLNIPPTSPSKMLLALCQWICCIL